MKKLLLLSVLGASIITPATAVYKCISLLPTTTCKSGIVSAGYVDWSGTASTGLKYSGTATCATTPADNNEIQNAIYVSTSTVAENAVATNTICFCRLVSPVVSKYVWAYSYASQMACAQGCAIKCSDDFVTTNSSLRTNILSNLLN
ncbi:MAG: hypothetical protein IJE82_00995, partial [Alphaproteobacteria bacterium]|nr:hypothetical protein [Alphaproteobacteria bacterium]